MEHSKSATDIFDHVQRSARWCLLIGGACLIVSAGLWCFLAATADGLPIVAVAARAKNGQATIHLFAVLFAAMSLLIGLLLSAGALRLIVPFATRPLRNLRRYGDPREIVREIQAELASEDQEAFPGQRLVDATSHVTRNWLVVLSLGGGLECVRLNEIARAFKRLDHMHRSDEEILLVEVWDSAGMRVQIRFSDDRSRDLLLDALKSRLPARCLA